MIGNENNLKRAFRLWGKYVKSRQTNLVFIRRFNLSAPKTFLFAYYSPHSFAASKMMYLFRGIPEEHAKILTIWFNSTFNILQVFLDRNETEGAFIGIPKYALMKMFILNPSTLNEKEKNRLLHLYDEIKTVEFPSLLDQLKDKFQQRVKIDKVILKLLGFNDSEIRQIFDLIYSALAKEIEQLKTLMAG
jgi:hypothetical protein